MSIPGGLRGMARRHLLSDFERGILDDLRLLDERVEGLETSEYAQPGAPGAAGGGLTLIEEILPTGLNLTFSSIPNTYRHLRLVWIAHKDATTAGETIKLQLNGDTASSYMHTGHRAIKGSLSTELHDLSSSNGLTASIPIGDVATDNADFDAGHAGNGIVFFPYYASDDFYKNVLTQHGSYVPSRNGFRHRLVTGNWENTDQITSIFIDGAASSNFTTGSSFSLYGIN